MTCPGCHNPIDPGWQYCVICGTGLRERAGAAAREHHVTVVVSDLQGSTALAERLDPERLRAVLDDYFGELGTVLESFGGRIEKRIGDAMVTVFGLPVQRPDDALRAAAAVAECQATLANLNDRLDRSFGVRLVNRTGIASGPVVFTDAGAGHRVLTGEALDIANTLEPAAPAFEALVAVSTIEELGDSVELSEFEVPAGAKKQPPPGSLKLVSVRGEVATMDPTEGVAADRCAACGSVVDVSHDEAGVRKWHWCPECGAPLASGARHRDSRRTLTIVFGDLRAIADDPTVTQQATTRCFEELRVVLERHGATVEKYIGDAVMAVWGLAQRHEDDALRAVRAALEMQRVVDTFNAATDLAVAAEGAPPVRIELRIGVNTGPVIAGDPHLGQRLVTGDAVNVAARLEQTAYLGAVVIGGLTRRLIGSAATVVELAPLTLKGKSEPVPAYRVVEVTDGAHRGEAHHRPFIGRGREFAHLRNLALEARDQHSMRRIDVVGDPGIGKTRLVREFIAQVGDRAQTLTGSCLPYGEGITFWPIVEVIRQAANFGPTDAVESVREAILHAVGDDQEVALRLGSLVGVYEQQYPVAESFWAVRRLVEQLSLTRPVILVIEGYHWSEPTLRDLIDSLTESLRDTPVLVVTVARSEIGNETPGVERLHLDPLTTEESDTLIQTFLGGSSLQKDIARKIRGAASGNPLFVEQFLTMLVDDGLLVNDGEVWRLIGDVADVSVPPTVEALLASRVDSLSDNERGTLEPAAVIGVEFGRAAVDAVQGNDDSNETALAALNERQITSPLAEPDVIVDHQFRSLMLRDVVYDGLLKRDRWGMHLRFADWLESLPELAGRVVELEEVLGYHLEQSFNLAKEVASSEDDLWGIGRRASVYLASAGERALARGDMPAAANLLCRATNTLAIDDPQRPPLSIRAGEALVETGAFKDANDRFAEAAAAGERTGDQALTAAAQMALIALRYQSGDGVTDAEAQAEIARLEPVLTAVGDHRSLARGHYVEMLVDLTHCQFGASERSAVASVEAARAAGDAVLEGRTLPLLAVVALHGPTHTDEAVERCRQMLERLTSDRRAQAMAERYLGVLLAMQDNFDEGRALCEGARDSLEELGWQFDLALVGLELGPLEMMADRPDAAERALRPGYDALEAMGEQNYISTVAALLAEALCRQQRFDEAQALAETARSVAAEDDVITQAFVRAVEAKLASAGGRHDEAIERAQEAVALLDATDDINSQADVLYDLAQVRRAAGDLSGAVQAAQHGLDRYTTKGCRPGVRRTSALLAQLSQ